MHTMAIIGNSNNLKKPMCLTKFLTTIIRVILKMNINYFSPIDFGSDSTKIHVQYILNHAMKLGVINIGKAKAKGKVTAMQI